MSTTHGYQTYGAMGGKLPGTRRVPHEVFDAAPLVGWYTEGPCGPREVREVRVRLEERPYPPYPGEQIPPTEPLARGGGNGPDADWYFIVGPDDRDFRAAPRD